MPLLSLASSIVAFLLTFSVALRMQHPLNRDNARIIYSALFRPANITHVNSRSIFIIVVTLISYIINNTMDNDILSLSCVILQNAISQGRWKYARRSIAQAILKSARSILFRSRGRGNARSTTSHERGREIVVRSA